MLSVAAGVSRIQPVTATQQMAKRMRRIESKRLHPIFEQSGGGGVQSCQYEALSAAGGVVLKRCCANFWRSTVSIWGPVHLDVILALDVKMAQIMILQATPQELLPRLRSLWLRTDRSECGNPWIQSCSFPRMTFRSPSPSSL